jgi:hypothetical protein
MKAETKREKNRREAPSSSGKQIRRENEKIPRQLVSSWTQREEEGERKGGGEGQE